MILIYYKWYKTVVDEISTIHLKKRKYDVPGVYYAAAFFYYDKRRVKGEFQLLEDMFKMMPQEHREEAFDNLNARAADQSHGPMLDQFPELKERLLGLPFDPTLPFTMDQN